MTETQLQTKIIKKLEKEGFFVIRIRASSENGTPDLIACRSGKFYAIEVKKEGKNATLIQNAIGTKIQRSGGVWCVIHTLDELANSEILKG